jgi:hypothetical protein
MEGKAMPKRVLASIIALVFLMQTSIAQNQEAAKTAGDWNIVELLTNRDKLEIELKSGARIKGKLANVSKTGLSISEGGKTTTLAQDEVLRIYQMIGMTRGKSTLRGTAIGTGIGAGIGLIIFLPHPDEISAVFPPAFAIIGAGIGAGVGAVFSGGQKRVLIYQGG